MDLVERLKIDTHSPGCNFFGASDYGCDCTLPARREAAGTILALQTQLERVERETVEKCALVCEDYAKSSWEEHKDADAQYAGEDCAIAIRAIAPKTEALP